MRTISVFLKTIIFFAIISMSGLIFFSALASDLGVRTYSLGGYEWTDARASESVCKNYCVGAGFTGGTVTVSGFKACGGASCSYIADFATGNVGSIPNDGHCGCSEQFTCSCVEPAATGTCKDSDNGISYFAKGYVDTTSAGSKGHYNDLCWNGTSELREWYCNGAKALESAYKCANGCSDGACIIASAVSSLRIISPNGGEKWAAGSTVTINWLRTLMPAQKNGLVTIAIKKGSGTSTILAQGITEGDSYDFIVPASLVSGDDYKIIITAGSPGSDLSDESDNYFSVVNKPDLIIESIAVEPENPTTADNICIYATVKNTGIAVISNDLAVQMEVNGSQKVNAYYGRALNAGEQVKKQILCSRYGENNAFKIGENSIKVAIDPGLNAVDESDESNNEKSLSFSIVEAGKEAREGDKAGDNAKNDDGKNGKTVSDYPISNVVFFVFSLVAILICCLMIWAAKKARDTRSISAGTKLCLKCGKVADVSEMQCSACGSTNFSPRQ